MSNYLGDLMYPSEKYLSNGEEKTRWLKCGGLFQSDTGAFSVKFDCVPLGMGDNKWFRVFEPRPQQPSAPSPQDARQAQVPIGGGGFDDDDIPF